MDLPDLAVRVDDVSQAQGLSQGTGGVSVVERVRTADVARAPVGRTVEPAPTTTQTGGASLEGESSAAEERESLDVDAVARQVYDLIMRRLTLERERVGYR